MEILLDAVLDSIKLLPFLYLVYVLMSYLEGHRENKLYHRMVNAQWSGPILGALIGCVPQCGFSVIGSKLYSKRMIGLGTLIAIFVSTSDEAVPILLAQPVMMPYVLKILVIKVVLAIIIGISIEGVMRVVRGRSVQIATSAGVIEGMIDEEETACSCGHHHEEAHQNIWLDALAHSLKTLLFIFVVNLILGFLIESVGEETIKAFLLKDSLWQPAIAALIGLIPNCAASIVLTEMFVSGALSMGALIAGLCTGAGVGLVVLFKSNKNIMDNLKIVGILYIVGTLSGMMIQCIGSYM